MTSSIAKRNGERIERLVATAAQQIAERGAAATSARSVAEVADSAASAINYNFGNIEQLFSRAFEYGAEQTAGWLDARWLEIAALPRTADGAALALNYVIVRWTRDARPLALLYQECLAATAGQGPGAVWTRLWRDFWVRAALGFGLGETDGRLLHIFFESEALYHLSAWSPALEEASLQEMCGHLGAVWLGATVGGPTGALALAERTARVRVVGSLPSAALKIAEASAKLVEDNGLDGLTHRAVAARAGVTTGAVTHYFRTVEDLVAGAIRGQVVAASRDGGGTIGDIHTSQQLFDALRAHAIADRPGGPALGRRRLFLAAVRRPDLASAAAVIRFAHGGTVRDALVRIFDVPDGMLSLHAGVLSRLLAPIWFASAADAAPLETREALVAEIQARLMRTLNSR